MSDRRAVVLGIATSVLVLLGLPAALMGYLFSDGFQRTARHERAAGKVFGESSSGEACAPEAFRRAEAMGFIDGMAAAGFADACLRSAAPSLGTCKDVALGPTGVFSMYADCAVSWSCIAIKSELDEYCWAVALAPR